MLDFRYDFCHFASLCKIDEVCVLQEVGISFFEEENVCLVLPKERNAGWVDGTKLLPIDLEVVVHVRACFSQLIFQITWDFLENKGKKCV